MHSKGYIHRDVRPQNLCIGLLDNSNTLYLSNFAHAKQYKNNKTGAHKPYSENKLMVGTTMFSSVNSHLGIGKPLLIYRESVKDVINIKLDLSTAYNRGVCV